jgi:NAD(P)-dependent dehydrogenase (short-subunit alcohol dehydrogenase family)
MAAWTAADMPSQAGRRVVVTGANSGIGFVTARELARAGAHVVLGCRDPGRGGAALERLRADVPDARAELARLDLADLASVREFADARTEPLDLLVNNAGVMALPRSTTADGFERQLGTNHLGHFALTHRLLDRLLEGDAPRVVTVASNAHRYGRIRFDDLQSERRYRRWQAYGQSKLANLLFAFELQRRAEDAGLELRSLAAHPGYAATHLTRQSSSERTNPLVRLGEAAITRVVDIALAQSDEQGALPSLYAATQELEGGTYVGPHGPGEWRGRPAVVVAASKAYNRELAARLWQASEELTDVRWLRPAAAQG